MTRLVIEVDVVDILATENFKSTEHYHRNGQTLALAEHDCYTFTGLFTELEDNGALLCCTKIIIYCWIAIIIIWSTALWIFKCTIQVINVLP